MAKVFQLPSHCCVQHGQSISVSKTWYCLWASFVWCLDLAEYRYHSPFFIYAENSLIECSCISYWVLQNVWMVLWRPWFCLQIIYINEKIMYRCKSTLRIIQIHSCPEYILASALSAIISTWSVKPSYCPW